MAKGQVYPSSLLVSRTVPRTRAVTRHRHTDESNTSPFVCRQLLSVALRETNSPYRRPHSAMRIYYSLYTTHLNCTRSRGMPMRSYPKRARSAYSQRLAIRAAFPRKNSARREAA